MRRFAWTAAVLLAAAGTAAAQEEPAKAPDFAAEVRDLKQAFETDWEAFLAPLRAAKTDEEREKLNVDWSKQPAHSYLPKFRDLADRAKGTEAGLQAWLWILGPGSNADDAGRKACAEALDAVPGTYMESLAMEQFVGALRYSGGWHGRERLAKILGGIAEKTPHARVRAAALLVRAAHAVEDDGAPAEAKKAARADLDEVLAKHADTPWGKQARGLVNELEHLQVGMVAPDFEAADSAGAKFRLSDYRGKVVVLDFWGFW